jgi:phycobilisome core-membrane linker protein
MKLEHVNHANGNGNNHFNPNLMNDSVFAAISATYRQIFGRDVLEGQRLISVESELLSGAITIREFVRLLGKSKLFRKMFWEPLYVTKAIEYIHRRLLGRPTYGRSEMNHYYDICANKGFYGLIDEIIDCQEYIDVFGEDTVPYERYLTPRGFAMRQSPSAYAANLSEKSSLSSLSKLDRFVPNHRNGKMEHLQESLNGDEVKVEEEILDGVRSYVQPLDTNSESEESLVNPT